MNAQAPALAARGVGKRFVDRQTRAAVVALDDVSFEAAHGELTALVGPDGAGKTTFLRLAAGLMGAQAGTLQVLGIDVARDPQAVQNRIGYMPQRFGLYEDLTVQENLDLYADLHGVPAATRRDRYARLMEMSALGPFTARLAGKLSGGMKQKLGLACTLVAEPELLLLDEPTVGVDPLSRHELWEILQGLVAERRTTVLVSTAYLDEAARCAQVVLLHQGRVLRQGTPQDIRGEAEGLSFTATPAAGDSVRRLQARLFDDPPTIDAVPRGGAVHLVRRDVRPDNPDAALQAVLAGARIEAVAPSLEDGFMVLLDAVVGGERTTAAPGVADLPAGSVSAAAEPPTVIEVRDVVRRFGDFTAVDRTTFSVRRGEIFGLLGPNGAGKTTTFRMLCGLLPASSGFLRVAGHDLRHARAQAREKIGYVSQKFALYASLTVDENLDFFGGAYGLRGTRLRMRREAVTTRFGLGERGATRAGELPGGYRQRLAMAAALLHEPEILFLDEPTSGADPPARREFWRHITTLAESGTTIVVTTHFMEEAEYCDRVLIQEAGRVLAVGTPLEIRRQAGERDGRPPDMEQAFTAIVAQARAAAGDRVAA